MSYTIIYTIYIYIYIYIYYSILYDIKENMLIKYIHEVKDNVTKVYHFSFLNFNFPKKKKKEIDLYNHATIGLSFLPQRFGDKRPQSLERSTRCPRFSQRQRS